MNVKNDNHSVPDNEEKLKLIFDLMCGYGEGYKDEPKPDTITMTQISIWFRNACLFQDDNLAFSLKIKNEFFNLYSKLTIDSPLKRINFEGFKQLIDGYVEIRLKLAKKSKKLTKNELKECIIRKLYYLKLVNKSCKKQVKETSTIQNLYKKQEQPHKSQIDTLLNSIMFNPHYIRYTTCGEGLILKGRKPSCRDFSL